MSFKPDELEMYPAINKSEDELEFPDEKEIIIDNGSDCIKIDLDGIRHNIEHLMSEENINVIVNKIRDFADKVRVEKENGVHLGSSDLVSAVSSEIFMMKPEELGLKTETEVKLIAELIKKSCGKEDRNELEMEI